MQQVLRRTFLAGTATALATGSVPAALAQDYPDKPVRVVVPFPPGGAADTFARLAGQKLGEAWGGKQVVVDNRPGAGGIIGTDNLAKSPADGYSLLVVTVGHAVNPFIYPKLPYDTAGDFVPVALLATVPSLLVVSPDVPAESVTELVALARSRPDELTYASSGIGSTSHVSVALLQSMTGTKLVHVPYKGAAAALNDVISGRVPMSIDVVTSSLPHVKAGKLRALAVTGAARSASAPDVPTMAEAGVPGYAFTAWYVLLAPARTPPAIIDRLNADVRRISAMPDYRDKIAGLGGEVGGTSAPAEVRGMLAAELARWEKVAREHAIKAE